MQQAVELGPLLRKKEVKIKSEGVSKGGPSAPGGTQSEPVDLAGPSSPGLSFLRKAQTGQLRMEDVQRERDGNNTESARVITTRMMEYALWWRPSEV